MTKTKRSRVLKISVSELIKLFQKYYPDAHCALEYSNPEELTIATVLSAQCTDARVNMVTRKLFKKYPNLKKLSEAKISELEQDVRSTGFYKNKAKNLHAMAKIVVEKFQGKVPASMEELVKLPGVGKKTANVVMGNAFNVASGVVVDTHVSRLSRRLGLTREKTPEKIENVLKKKIPQNQWILFSHWLIWHGRGPCKARKPACEKCFLDSVCPKIL